MAKPLGERFARAIADKDAGALKALVRSDVDFRAMTPAKFWESTDADVVVDDTILGTWFPEERKIAEILSIETGAMGPLEHVAYRFRVGRPDGEFVLEQQAYFKTAGDRISWLRIMCSGFLRLEDAEASSL